MFRFPEVLGIKVFMDSDLAIVQYHNHDQSIRRRLVKLRNEDDSKLVSALGNKDKVVLAGKTPRHILKTWRDITKRRIR